MSEYSYGTCSECGARIGLEDGVPIEDECPRCGQRWNDDEDEEEDDDGEEEEE
jgi:RNA polymerase-binding transcription factor DksA